MAPKLKGLSHLEATWYNKLKESGFEDIEDTRYPDRPLKDYHDGYFRERYDPVRFEAKQTYYQRAAQYLEAVYGDRHQDPKPESSIWELHSQGLSVRKIGEQLGIHYLQVHFVVRRIAAKIKGNA